MIYREFGKTGLKVSMLGFGSMRLPMVDIGKEHFVDIERSVELIRYAFSKGINYIDTGFLYCNRESELAVGRALKGMRDKVVLTTKATKLRLSKKGDLRRMLEHQLYKLDLEYIDFYCFHSIGWDNFNTIDKQIGWKKEMLKAKDEGIIKHIGFSFHDKPENMPKLIDLGFFEMVTCQYNYFNYSNEEAIAYAKQKGLGVVVMGPVGGGTLAKFPGFLKKNKALQTNDAAKLALKFVFSNPDVDVAISGMNTKKMVSENIKAANGVPLSKKEYKTIRELSEKNRKLAELYCTGCGYCIPCKQGVLIPARFEAMIYHKVYDMKAHAKKRYMQIRKIENKREGKGVCIECGVCEKKCPQNIRIIKQLQLTEKTLGKTGS